MRNYVIINGVNSLTIQGLAIKTLPPITKPIQRNLREEIDGRDGDIVTTLGYGAYDKTIEIGLFGTFDIDEVIAYFNQKGTITFSNEADKVYYFQALDQVDYAELLKFRTANVVLHCQPFKYPLNETPLVEEYEYVTGTGTDITLDNTEETEFNEIELQGNIFQQTYTGKNKLGLADGSHTPTQGTGISVSVSNDKITITGTASGINIIDIPLIQPIPASLGTLMKSLNSKGTYTGVQTSLRKENGDTVGLWSTNGANQSGTLSADAYYLRIQVNDTIQVNCTMEAQVETGSSATSFEPYVGGIPSPSPSYPQPIQVVSGDNEIEITGRNVFDIEQLMNKASNVEELGEGYYKFGNNSPMYNTTTPLGFIPNDKITISYKAKNITGTNFQLRIVYEDGYIGETTGTGTSTEEQTIMNTSTQPSTHGKVIGLRANWSNSGYFEIRDLMVNIGDTQQPYEPYTSQSLPLNLGSLEMASIPNTDYKDLFVKENDTWYKRKAIEKIVLDGTEYWALYSASGSAPRRFGVQDRDRWYKNGIPIMSDYFIGGEYNSQIDLSIWTQTQCLAITDKNSNWANASALKTWLTTHNAEVRYALEETTDIEITNETLIEQLEAIKNAISYNEQTNISQTNNDLPFILDLSALKENSDHLIIDNIGNIYSKPTLDLEGTGIVDIYLNDTQMFEVDLSEKNEIVIDTEKMEAYNPTDNTLANRQVTGDYSKFKLDSGENDLRFSGDLTKATITRYERWL